MITIEVTRLASYATCIIACAVLAVYFLRAFLNKRLRAFLWWATGFSLLACGILATAVGAFYGFHKILGMVTFVLVAVSVTFLYYAASLLLYGRKSFFREKFTVILFVVSSVLFVLPLYFFSDRYVANIIESPTMVLFAAAFLVLAVLFSFVIKVAVRPPKEYLCRRVGALQSLMWVVAVWSLYIAFLWQSVIAVGLVFVLSLCGFVLLWNICTGGDMVIVEDYEKVNLLEIDGVEDKIKRVANAAQVRLNDSMQQIGDTLLMLRIENEKEPKTKEIEARLSEMDLEGEDLMEQIAQEVRSVLEREKDFIKRKMVACASEVGMREEDLIERVVELAETVLELVRSYYKGEDLYRSEKQNPSQVDRGDCPDNDGDCPDNDGYGPSQKDKIPFGEMGEQGEEASDNVPEHALKILALLARTKSSADNSIIMGCCNLVIDVCSLENNAVTKYKWAELPDEEHPRGMIGHTYNILRTIDVRTPTNERIVNRNIVSHADQFRKEFQSDADTLFKKIDLLRKDAAELMCGLPSPPGLLIQPKLKMLPTMCVKLLGCSRKLQPYYLVHQNLYRASYQKHQSHKNKYFLFSFAIR